MWNVKNWGLKVSDISSKNCPSPYVGTRIDDRSHHRRRRPYPFKEEVGEQGGKASFNFFDHKIY